MHFFAKQKSFCEELSFEWKLKLLNFLTAPVQVRKWFVILHNGVGLPLDFKLNFVRNRTQLVLTKGCAY